MSRQETVFLQTQPSYMSSAPISSFAVFVACFLNLSGFYVLEKVDPVMCYKMSQMEYGCES